MCAEFYERAAEDMSSGFGGLHGRGAKRQDPAIERELVLSLEEIFHGCTKKMKISRRVWFMGVRRIFSRGGQIRGPGTKDPQRGPGMKHQADDRLWK